MKFGSVCSGIEAASVAWHPLGWTAAWLSEIEPFPCAVLKHHYPDVPNHGDMTLLPEKILSGQVEAPDLFCGGTPCQAFSVAGLRNSLDDARGNLSLTFVGIANAIDHVRSLRGDAPAIVFWENVPGVLNTKDNAFGCFLGALAGESDPITAPGERWSNAGCVFGPQRTVAWRVLDAQYFGVAQRRRRVFVVASARDDINPTEILFEFEGVRRDTPQSRKTGQRPTTSAEVSPRVSSGGLQGRDDCGVELSGPLSARDYKDAGTDGMNKISAKMIPVVQELVGALDTECGGNKSLAQYREANVSGTIKRSGGVAGGGSETFLSQPVAVYENHPSDSRVTELGDVSSTVRARWGTGGGNAPMVSQPMVSQPMVWDTTNITSPQNGSNPQPGDPCFTLAKGQHPPLLTKVAQPVGVDSYNLCETGDITQTIKSPSGGFTESIGAVHIGMAVRRLTPVECERLQGFPDGYTNIPWRKAAESPDGPRYKALGNSWAVPVVAWIGQRIQDQIK
jgi:DNA (cytosine-5)-methyltransferase 1